MEAQMQNDIFNGAMLGAVFKLSEHVDLDAAKAKPRWCHDKA
jgi:hypothetical protein